MGWTLRTVAALQAVHKPSQDGRAGTVAQIPRAPQIVNDFQRVGDGVIYAVGVQFSFVEIVIEPWFCIWMFPVQTSCSQILSSYFPN